MFVSEEIGVVVFVEMKEEEEDLVELVCVFFEDEWM